MSGCKIDRDNADTITMFDSENRRIYNGLLEKWFGKDRTEEIIAELEAEGYDAHTFMTERELDIRLIKRYGKKNVRMALADKIMLVIKSHPAVADIVYASLLVKIPDYVNMGDRPRGENVYTGIDKEPFQLNLDRFPESTLRVVLGSILNQINQTTQSGAPSAKIGGKLTKFKTPKKIKKMGWGGIIIEPILSAVRTHANKISSTINLFRTSPDFILKEDVDPELRKKVKRGIEHILDDVDRLDDIGPLETRAPDNKDRFQQLFAAIMKNYIFFGKDGRLYINQDYTPRREYSTDGGKTWTDINYVWSDKAGKYVRTLIPKGAETRKKIYESTGKKMFSFQNPTLLETYVPPHGKQSLHMDMNQAQFDKLKELTEEARHSTNLIFDYFFGNNLKEDDPKYRPGKMKESTDALLNGLIEHFDNKLSEYAIRQIFFHGNTTVKDREGNEIDLLAGLNENEKAEINYVIDAFSMTSTDDLVIANGGSIQPDSAEFRKNYWPTQYNFDVFREMIFKNISDFKKLVSDAKKMLTKLETEKPKNWQLKYDIITDKLKKLEEQLESLETISNNMDDYHLDNNTGSLMHFANDNKHFKRISNSYDIMNSRLDRGLMFDYLKRMSSAVEKNNMNLALLEVLKRIKQERSLSKPRITEEEIGAVLRTAVNYHGSTYSSLKMTGILGDMETFTRRWKWLRYLSPRNLYMKWKHGDDYDIHISPKLQATYLRTLLTSLSGLFLQSINSVRTNASGAHKNIVKKGWKTTYNAFKVMTGKYSAGVKKIVQQSGVTEFSDFFSQSMVNGILKMQIEGEIADKILSQMLLYHDRIGKYVVVDKKLAEILGKKEGKRIKLTAQDSRDIFDAEVAFHLSKSDLWMSAEEIEIRSKKRVLHQDKERRARMRLYAANKLVQWAINKEYAMKPILKHKDWIQWAKYQAFLPIGKVAVASSQFYKAFPVTMSHIEGLIRTLSFVMGAELAWKAGNRGLRNDIHWTEYTDQESIDKIMQIGIEFNFEMNFGMSVQDVGQFQFGAAQILGKFKYWNQQNYEDEMEIVKQAFMYFEDLNLETDDFKKIQTKGYRQALKKVMRLLKYTVTPKQLGLDRHSRQELAAFKYMMTSGALVSFLYQTFFWNPLNMRHFPDWLYKSIKTMSAVGWKTGMMHQLRSFAISDLMKAATFIPAMIARSAIGPEEEDFEERELFWSHWLSFFPWAGYGIIWTYDVAISFIALFMEEEEVFIEKAERGLSVNYGRPALDPFGLSGDLTKKAGQGVTRAVYETIDDMD